MDDKIEKIIEDWKQKLITPGNTHYFNAPLGYTLNGNTVHIWTPYPGIMVGKFGRLISEYEKKFEELGLDICMHELRPITKISL